MPHKQGPIGSGYDRSCACYRGHMVTAYENVVAPGMSSDISHSSAERIIAWTQPSWLTTCAQPFPEIIVKNLTVFPENMITTWTLHLVWCSWWRCVDFDWKRHDTWEQAWPLFNRRLLNARIMWALKNRSETNQSDFSYSSERNRRNLQPKLLRKRVDEILNASVWVTNRNEKGI